MNKKGKILFFVVAIISLFLIYCNFFTNPTITKIDIKNSITEDDKVIINVNVKNNLFKFNKKTWCSISTNETENLKDVSWQKADNGYCSFTVDDDKYYVFIKDFIGHTNKNSVDKFLINLEKDKFYMYVGLEDEIKTNDNSVLSFESSMPNIVSVSDTGKIKAISNGTANITVKNKNNASKDVKVYVTNLIKPPSIDNSRKKVTCGQFSESEADMLDNALFDRIDKAGYKTRSGAVEAARFLTLELSYKIPYFFENGRLNNYAPYRHVDGEGRYYHRGLYLNENKFNYLNAILVGPATWGCDLKNFTNWSNYQYNYVEGNKYPNGLDCSGFVSWVLLNGGFDVGDIGAGENPDHDDLDDIGVKVYINSNTLKEVNVRVGDLIGNNGHAAIIAGMDENNIYIAESLPNLDGVTMTTVSKSNLANSIYTFIILMDDVYKEDGNLTDMW